MISCLDFWLPMHFQKFQIMSVGIFFKYIFLCHIRNQRPERLMAGGEISLLKKWLSQPAPLPYSKIHAWLNWWPLTEPAAFWRRQRRRPSSAHCWPIVPWPGCQFHQGLHAGRSRSWLRSPSLPAAGSHSSPKNIGTHYQASSTAHTRSRAATIEM